MTDRKCPHRGYDRLTALELQSARRGSIRQQLAAFVKEFAERRGHSMHDLERAYWPSHRETGDLWRIAFVDNAKAEDAVFGLMALGYRVGLSVLPADDADDGHVLEFHPRDFAGVDLVAVAKEDFPEASDDDS